MPKQSLGAEKTGTCDFCQSPFSKKRFDQRLCSDACRREAKGVYNQGHWMFRRDRELRNQKRKELYLKNREVSLAKAKQWRKENPEESKAKSRSNYEKYKEKHTERTKKYRQMYPEVRQREYRNARQRRPWERSLSNARSRSMKKKLAFDLTREWCEQTWTGFCALTGLPFKFGSQTLFPFTVSIDRINSNLGYIQSNCRFVLFAVNSLRGSGSDDEMYQIAEALLAYRDQKRAPATP